MHRMGQRIKKRRESLNIQTVDLASQIGVTSSLISQIERGKAFPSILTLKKIADALQTSVGILIGEQATFIKNPVMKASDRKFAKRNKKGASLFLLSHHDSLKQMDPFIIEFKKNGDSRNIMTPKNPRQEFIYVLKGSFKVDVNDTAYTIHEGDSFYFYSSQKHLFTNISEEAAQFIWVVNQANTH